MTNLTERLKQIKERVEAATQGNWSGAVEFLEGPSREDKDFIAHSRQDIEMLLEMVESLVRQRNEALRQHEEELF